jgi:hypothetical protein
MLESDWFMKHRHRRISKSRCDKIVKNIVSYSVRYKIYSEKIILFQLWRVI